MPAPKPGTIRKLEPEFRRYCRTGVSDLHVRMHQVEPAAALFRVPGQRCFLPTQSEKRPVSSSRFSNPAAIRCIQSGVTGLGLLKRVLLVMTLVAGLMTFLGATGHASPIRPD